MAYHWAHLDASHAKAAAWKAANRDRVKAYNEAYYAADVEEARARVARWRAANPESVRAYRERTKGRLAAYYRANAERASQQARERRLADPARNKARCAAWGKANPGKKRALDLRRRRRIEFNGGHYTGVEWAALKARYDYRCLMCGRSEPEIKLTFDHVVPVALGGTNDIGNGQPLCRPCNLSKGARTLDFR
jgi:5-methylcytosine-specific restriction endonuclease McrA